MRALLVLLCLLAGAASAEEVLADRVSAVVGNTPITASQVALDEELVALLPDEGCEESFGRLLCDDAVPLQRLVFRQVLREAGLGRNVEVSSLAGVERWTALEARFANREEARSWLARWGLDPEAVSERFLELARLDQAIDVAVGRLVRDVSEQDERRYHREHQDTIFAGKPYEEVSAVVSRRYYLLVFERTYDAWASELRAAARVRYISR